VLDRGTANRTADDIADVLDSRGAALSVSVGRHTMTMATTCLSDDLNIVLGLVAELVQAPSFPETEVATRRTELLTTIRQADDDPATVATDTLMRDLYAGHPYARRMRGTSASVVLLGREDLTAFHRGHVRPQEIVFSVVGDVDAAAVVAHVSRELGDWQRPSAERLQPVPDVDGPSVRQLRAVPMMDKAQTDVAYGFVGLRRRDPEYYAAMVMNNALGQYALGGRLGDSIRERQGMAYYVSSQVDAGFGAGPVLIRAGVAAANVERAIQSIDAELNAIRQDGLSEKEVEDTKRYLVGSLPRQLETNAAIASFLINAELFELGLDFDVRYPDIVSGITRDAANAAARRLLDPARATIVVAGPWSAPSSSTSTSR
jgi:zinc protease